MNKIIKSLKDPGVFTTYSGQELEGGQSYPIPASELESFQNNEALEIDILSGVAAVISDLFPGIELTGNDGLDFLKDAIDSPIVNAPFESKMIDGKSLFRRKHGLVKDCSQGNTEFEFVVPYNNVKINEVEFVNCEAGDSIDLFVHDTPQGHVQISMGVPPGSITPSLILNQFGFDAATPNGFYKDVSKYDADLIKDMKVRAVYKHAGATTIKNGMNIVFHELK